MNTTNYYSQSSYYMEGYNHCKDGFEMLDNPYSIPMNEERFNSWSAGWRAADQCKNSHNEIFNELQSFFKYPIDWNGEGCRKPDYLAIRHALITARYYSNLGYLMHHTIPSLNGDIVLYIISPEEVTYRCVIDRIGNITSEKYKGVESLMINKEITFTITDKHLKLLQQMYVDWNDCETGAPSIDCKRPYGNSDVPGDIHLILTGKNLSDFDDDLVETLSNEYYELHEETQTALQICLCTQLFETGEYVKKNSYDNRSWVKKFENIH